MNFQDDIGRYTLQNEEARNKTYSTQETEAVSPKEISGLALKGALKVAARDQFIT